MKMRTFISFAGSICLLILLSNLLGCRDQRILKVILPNGFHGKVYIIQDPSSRNAILFDHGVAALRIPENGEIRVQSLAVLSDWIEVDWMYANGPSLSSNPATYRPKSISVFPLAMGSAGNGLQSAQYFVGTLDEYNKLEPTFTTLKK